jgi:hypothetical protein
MNLGEIKAECWDHVRDTAIVDEDRLWTSDEMDRYINRIYRDIARKTLCIYDNTTIDVCTIASTPVDWTTYTPGTLDYIWANDPDNWLYHKDVAPYLYPLHKSILEVNEVKWTSRPWKLSIVSVSKWQTNPWWENVIGAPTECAFDLESRKLALNFRSEETDTIRLAVNRLPLTDLSDSDDEPEFKEDYHYLFKNGILSLMYLKQDSDTFDKDKAIAAKADYLADIDEIKQQESIAMRRLRPNEALGAFR